MASTAFEKQGISIFQISNDKQAFIFDMEKISHLSEFQDLFFGLLANKDIIKVKFLHFLKENSYKNFSFF